MAELFTLAEAAAIAEIEPGMIRTAPEKRAVTPSRKVKTGKAVRYRFSEGDVLYLLVVTEFPFPLSSGEPVFHGTRIPLEHVAALFRKNVPEEEIAEDFPALDAKDLQYARLAARFGAAPG
jgi:hypothetical protein